MEKETTDKDGTSDLARPLPARQKLYTELGSDDVLLGRGTGPNEFEGNIRFRRLVGEVAMATDPKGLLSNKPALARKVVDQVAKRGGRFVRKLSKGEILALATNTTPINKRKDLYVEVPHAVAIEKAKQSFRHQEKILLDRRRAGDDTKGIVVVGTPLVKAPAALSITRDDRLEPSSKSRRRVDGIEQKDDIGIRLNAGSSSMMAEISSTQHSSLETMSRREQHTASIPSSLMEYSNALSQSLAWQTLPMDATSFLSAQQQQSARFTSPQNPTLLRSSAFSQVRPGILDPSSLIYIPQSLGLTQNASSMDLLNEVSRRHELASLLASAANSTTPQAALPSPRIGDAASQQQELHQIQPSASLLELLHDYYSPVVSASSLATTSWTTAPPLPLPSSWSTSALLQNSSLVLGLMGGSGGTSLTGAGSMDHSPTNSIMQQQQQQQQFLLASLVVGGTSGRSQDSSGGRGFLGGGPLGLQDSSSAGGRVLEAVTESLRLGAAADPPDAAATRTTTTTTVATPAPAPTRTPTTTTAPAPLSNVGTDGSRWPPSSAYQSSSVPSETDSNDLADEQQASLLEYILRLRRS